MEGDVARITDWAKARRKLIQLAIIMHGTSPRREKAARQLAKACHEANADGVAFGFADRFSPTELNPLHFVRRTPTIKWSERFPDTESVSVQKVESGFWKLLVRGMTPERREKVEDTLKFVAGYLTASLDRDRPALPDDCFDCAYPEYIEFLTIVREFSYALPVPALGPDAYAHALRDRLLESVPLMPESCRQSATELAEAIDRPLVMVKPWLQLGEDLEFAGHYPQAIAVYHLCYELVLLLLDHEAGTTCARKTARAYRKAARFEEAKAWYGLAIRISEHTEYFSGLALSLDGLGNMYASSGAWKEAYFHYDRASEFAFISRDRLAQAATAHSLSFAHFYAKRYEESMRYAWKSLELETQPDQRSRLLMTLATSARELGDYDAALDAYRLAEYESTERDMLALAIDAQGYIAALQGDHGKYEHHRRRGRVLWRGAAPEVRAQLWFYRGKVCLLQGRPDDARRVLGAGERYASKHSLAMWSVLAGELADDIAAGRVTPPDQGDPTRAPETVRRGLRELISSPSP